MQVGAQTSLGDAEFALPGSKWETRLCQCMCPAFRQRSGGGSFPDCVSASHRPSAEDDNPFVSEGSGGGIL